MRLTTLSFLLALSSLALAQAPFERIYTMPGALDTYGATMDADGNFVIISENEGDLQVSRISPDGEHQWTRTYPYFADEGLYGNGIAVGPLGNIVVVGFTMGTLTNSRDGIILNIATDGTLGTVQRIDAGTGSNALHYLKATPDGFIASGRAEGTSGNQYDMLLAKLDASGTMLWSRTFGTTGWDWGYEATPLADGGYAMVGYADQLGTGFSPSGYLVRTDATGNEMWARSISSGGGVDEAYCVIENSNGDLYVGGRSLGYIAGDVTAWLTKISSTGTHLWTRILEHGIEVQSLTPAANGGVNWLARPQYLPGGGGDYDIAWGTFSADGTLLSSHLHGGTGSDVGNVLFNMPGGGHAISGITNTGTTAWSGNLIVTDAAGNGGCRDIDLPLNWTSATAIVAPYTSLVASGFTAYPYMLGQVTVAVSSMNPCCIENAAFTMQAQSDVLTWNFTDGSTGANSYAWDFGDGTTSTEASPSHTYAGNGTYIVCLTITGDCSEATTCQNISISVGVEDINGGADAPRLFPSPASDQFTIESPRTPIKTLELTDSNGRLVRTIDGTAIGRMEVPVDALT
ncbi:MAG: PKD domain-containing protein, partial [Flavobacteriales bacterium]